MTDCLSRKSGSDPAFVRKQCVASKGAGNSQTRRKKKKKKKVSYDGHDYIAVMAIYCGAEGAYQMISDTM